MLTSTNLFNTFILCGRCERNLHAMNEILKGNTHAKLVSSTFTFDRFRCCFHPSWNTVLRFSSSHYTTSLRDMKTQYRSCHNKDNLPCHGGFTSSYYYTFIITSPVRILVTMTSHQWFDVTSPVTHRLVISFFYTSVVHHINQWQLGQVHVWCSKFTVLPNVWWFSIFSF